MADAPSLGTQVNRGVAWAAVAQAVIAISDGVSQMIVMALLINATDLGIAAAAMAYLGPDDNHIDVITRGLLSVT